MKKVLLVATVQSHIAQFHRPLGELLHEYGYEIHVAAKNNLALKNGLKLDWPDKIFDVSFSRSPKSPDNLKALSQLKEIINSQDYDIIHCNTPMGGIITRIASKKTRQKGTRVFYTAHGFHFHKRASKLAWLTYYPIEKFFTRYTDKLITINKEDYELARNKFKCHSHYIHGVGVNAKRYQPLKDETEYRDICNHLNISPDSKIILSIGELLPNKNQKMAIQAMKEVVKQEPSALLIIAGNGPKDQELKDYIAEMGLQDSVRMIGYCTHLELYQKIAQIVVACSYREGLPLNIVEAMLAENPVVASHNRGHDELIEHEKTGYLVEVNDSTGMAFYIKNLLKDNNLRNLLGKNGRIKALNYTFDAVKEELRDIYELEST